MIVRFRQARGWLTVAALALSAFVITDASGAGVAYTYDLSGRVATGLYDNGLCLAYQYDASGNRTSQVNSTPGAPAWGSGTWGCFSWTP